MALHPTGPELRGLSLCAGFGGLDLGLHIAEPGYRTVCFVEREAAAAAALVGRMADAAFRPAPVWDDVGTFDGRPWRGRVHLVAAGYPCQPFSYNGKRKGTRDPRHIWPDISRIIGESRPEWVFLENVPGHLTLGFPEVARGLQALGFAVKAGVFSAAEAGASHTRERLFVVAHADRPGHRNSSSPRGRARRGEVRQRTRLRVGPAKPEDLGRDLDRVHAGAESGRRMGRNRAIDAPPLFAPDPDQLDLWRDILAADPALQPALPRPADGAADWVDRQRGAGNGVCPLAAALAWSSLRASFGV